jgi:hypothetical protein
MRRADLKPKRKKARTLRAGYDWGSLVAGAGFEPSFGAFGLRLLATRRLRDQANAKRLLRATKKPPIRTADWFYVR